MKAGRADKPGSFALESMYGEELIQRTCFLVVVVVVVVRTKGGRGGRRGSYGGER